MWAFISSLDCPFVSLSLQRPLHLTLALLAFIRALHGVSGVGFTQAHIQLCQLEGLLVQASYRPAFALFEMVPGKVYTYSALVRWNNHFQT